MISVDSWPVEQFLNARSSKTLIVSPEYQRRPVWNAKDKMLLVDSIARGIPIGAITLYQDAEPGYAIYEVIDGKQRLTALIEYSEDVLVVRTSAVDAAANDDDDYGTEDVVTQAFHEKKFSELDVAARMRLLQYKVPIFIVSGSRASAIRAFTRMNRTPYALKPQEIRNAFFMGTPFLDAAIGAVKQLDEDYGNPSTPSFFVSMGIVGKQQYDRMQDIQLASELILLKLRGPQHRRDALDTTYELYRRAGGAAVTELKDAADAVVAASAQIWGLAGGTVLSAHHFPSSCENDYYALVGSLFARGLLTKPQLTALSAELIAVISGFREQVENYVALIRGEETPTPGEFSPLVEDYGRGFLGGQINSKQRREDRIRIWTEVMNGVVATLDPATTFSEIQRRLIWAKGGDKACARCGNTVEWPDYHAGHRIARAMGGKTQVDNGQVEHAACNQSAGPS